MYTTTHNDRNKLTTMCDIKLKRNSQFSPGFSIVPSPYEIDGWFLLRTQCSQETVPSEEQ